MDIPLKYLSFQRPDALAAAPTSLCAAASKAPGHGSATGHCRSRPSCYQKRTLRFGLVAEPPVALYHGPTSTHAATDSGSVDEPTDSYRRLTDFTGYLTVSRRDRGGGGAALGDGRRLRYMRAR